MRRDLRMPVKKNAGYSGTPQNAWLRKLRKADEVMSGMVALAGRLLFSSRAISVA